MAIDWTVLMEWFIVTIVIAIVVGVTHSFYGASNDRRKAPRYRMPELARPSTGYFIQVTGADIDSMLLYAEEMFRTGKLDECIKTSFSTAEDILEQAALKMGIPPEHSTLAELGRRLAEAGLSKMGTSELDMLDTAVRFVGQPLSSATASRALGAAVYVRSYLTHAPVELPPYRGPIGVEGATDAQV